MKDCFLIFYQKFIIYTNLHIIISTNIVNIFTLKINIFSLKRIDIWFEINYDTSDSSNTIRRRPRFSHSDYRFFLFRNHVFSSFFSPECFYIRAPATYKSNRCLATLISIPQSTLTVLYFFQLWTNPLHSE